MFSTSLSTKPLELLFMDVWGPSPILSNRGYCFYLLINNDFTRYSWLFPLHQKSQVISSFVQFKSTVKNMFSTKIKVVQTEEGKEFVNRQFQNLLNLFGISHRRSCPYTPEQMGFVERKHKRG